MVAQGGNRADYDHARSEAQIMSAQPVRHRWQDLPAEDITATIARRYLTGDRVTVARFERKRGGVVPRHAHDNEQVSCVLSGSLEFNFDGRKVAVGAGEV